METDHVLDHIVLQSIELPPVLDNLQTEEATKESIEVPPEHVLEVVLNDITDLAVELPPKPVQEVLLQNLWGLTGPGKKTRSIKKLCHVEPSSEKNNKRS